MSHTTEGLGELHEQSGHKKYLDAPDVYACPEELQTICDEMGGWESFLEAIISANVKQITDAKLPGSMLDIYRYLPLEKSYEAAAIRMRQAMRVDAERADIRGERQLYSWLFNGLELELTGVEKVLILERMLVVGRTLRQVLQDTPVIQESHGGTAGRWPIVTADLDKMKEGLLDIAPLATGWKYTRVLDGNGYDIAEQPLSFSRNVYGHKSLIPYGMRILMPMYKRWLISVGRAEEAEHLSVEYGSAFGHAHDIGRAVTMHDEIHERVERVLFEMIGYDDDILKYEFPGISRYTSDDPRLVDIANIPPEQLIFIFIDIISKFENERTPEALRPIESEKLQHMSTDRAVHYYLKQYGIERRPECSGSQEERSTCAELIRSLTRETINQICTVLGAHTPVYMRELQAQTISADELVDQFEKEGVLGVRFDQLWLMATMLQYKIDTRVAKRYFVETEFISNLIHYFSDVLVSQQSSLLQLHQEMSDQVLTEVYNSIFFYHRTDTWRYEALRGKERLELPTTFVASALASYSLRRMIELSKAGRPGGLPTASGDLATTEEIQDALTLLSFLEDQALALRKREQ